MSCPNFALDEVADVARGFQTFGEGDPDGLGLGGRGKAGCFELCETRATDGACAYACADSMRKVRGMANDNES